MLLMCVHISLAETIASGQSSKVLLLMGLLLHLWHKSGQPAHGSTMYTLLAGSTA